MFAGSSPGGLPTKLKSRIHTAPQKGLVFICADTERAYGGAIIWYDIRRTTYGEK